MLGMIADVKARPASQVPGKRLLNNTQQIQTHIFFGDCASSIAIQGLGGLEWWLNHRESMSSMNTSIDIHVAHVKGGASMSLVVSSSFQNSNKSHNHPNMCTPFYSTFETNWWQIFIWKRCISEKAHIDICIAVMIYIVSDDERELDWWDVKIMCEYQNAHPF